MVQLRLHAGGSTSASSAFRQDRPCMQRSCHLGMETILVTVHSHPTAVRACHPSCTRKETNRAKPCGPWCSAKLGRRRGWLALIGQSDTLPGQLSLLCSFLLLHIRGGNLHIERAYRV
ncbi:hypothetical protein M404DRAFT_390250 [Pisolithus tinctorius Marx 270]|uniref:Uncharacterized protein n=1 Tax=Pisolithus tinctorius Marx 270 TaxID=870435 RepID=A0A0C3PHV5_PISTI|nr:hypothetical protein M404DRAFT_390250 [Pisolithus tinctorius Marx 270]